MEVVLPSIQAMLSNNSSIPTVLESEIQWRVLIQRANGRNIPHAFSIRSRDSGEEVMKKLHRLYIEGTTAFHRIFIQTILMRRPVVSIVRITAVCPESSMQSNDERTNSLTYQSSSPPSHQISKPSKILPKSTSHTQSATKT